MYTINFDAMTSTYNLYKNGNYSQPIARFSTRAKAKAARQALKSL